MCIFKTRYFVVEENGYYTPYKKILGFIKVHVREYGTVRDDIYHYVYIKSIKISHLTMEDARVAILKDSGRLESRFYYRGYWIYALYDGTYAIRMKCDDYKRYDNLGLLEFTGKTLDDCKKYINREEEKRLKEVAIIHKVEI